MYVHISLRVYFKQIIVSYVQAITDTIEYTPVKYSLWQTCNACDKLHNENLDTY